MPPQQTRFLAKSIQTVVDCHTREALSLTLRANFRAFQVTEALDVLVRLRGRPKSLRVDNGREFAGRMLDQWAYLNGVAIDFSRPGKPTDNAYIEAFNGRLPPECVNASRFCRRPMPASASRNGGATTTKIDLIWHRAA